MNRTLLSAIVALALCTGAQNTPAPIIVQGHSAQQAQAELTFDAPGHVQSCTILKSTGDPQLDRKTCDLLRERCVMKGITGRQLACTGPVGSAPTEHRSEAPVKQANTHNVIGANK